MLLSLNVAAFYVTFRTYREEPQYFYIYRMLGVSSLNYRLSIFVKSVKGVHWGGGRHCLVVRWKKEGKRVLWLPRK